jgi:hypothetical protein
MELGTFRDSTYLQLQLGTGVNHLTPYISSNSFLSIVIKVLPVGLFLKHCIFFPLNLLINPFQSTIGPDRLVTSPPIPWGTVSPMGNLFEVILLLAACLDRGITDRLPPPVLFNILTS